MLVYTARVPKQRFTVTWEAGVREGEDGGGPTAKGVIGVVVDALDWRDALDEVGKALTFWAEQRRPMEADLCARGIWGPRVRTLTERGPERPSSWDRVQEGPNHDEAKRLALAWLEQNTFVSRACDRSLIALLEGLLDRRHSPDE